MALTTDTSTAFTSSTGYTLFEESGGDVAFSAGLMFLSGSATKRAAVRTPQINVSGWTPAIRSVGITNAVAVGFQFRYLVSFENWSSASTPQRYYRYEPGAGWLPIADYSYTTTQILDTLDARGMYQRELEAVREWPEIDANTRLSFLVGMKRTVNASGGNIDVISVTYGDKDLELTADASLGLLEYHPEGPVEPQFGQSFARHSFGDGHERLVETGTKLRRSYSLTWPAMDEADADTLETFLKNARGSNYFLYQFHGDSAQRKWKVVSEVRNEQAGVRGLNRVSASIQEVTT